MIDIQAIQGGNQTDWQQQLADVETVWRDAGVLVLDRSAELPDVVRGVPARAISGRRGGGAGGGLEQQALQISLNLWPLAVAGYVGAVSADAWALTKIGVSIALKKLLGRTTSKVAVKVADRGTGLNDDTYVFQASDLPDIDRALDSMADNVIERAKVKDRSWMQYLWDGSSGKWMPDPRFALDDDQ